jgi:hypothetical protein
VGGVHFCCFSSGFSAERQIWFECLLLFGGSLVIKEVISMWFYLSACLLQILSFDFQWG